MIFEVFGGCAPLIVPSTGEATQFTQADSRGPQKKIITAIADHTNLPGPFKLSVEAIQGESGNSIVEKQKRNKRML